MSGKMGDDAIAKMERLRKEQQKLESERYEKKFGKKGVVQEI